MDQGQVIQAGTPRDLYERPANLFAAGFIGSPRMNFMPCAVDGGRFTLPEQQGGAHGVASDGTPTRTSGRSRTCTWSARGGGLVARLAETKGIKAGDTVE